MTHRPIRILIVDDTVVYRRILTEVVESLEDTQVAGTAPQGRLALAKLEQDRADLVLLDVEMPEMDGLQTLQEIRKRFPDTSVVMISGANTHSAAVTIKALENGALDFIRKPEGNDAEASRSELRDALRPLLRHVRTRLNLLHGSHPAPAAARPSPAAAVAREPVPRVAPRPSHGSKPTRIDVVGIGVSTGGPNALAQVIPALPGDLGVPVLIVQHMPPFFTASLAENLAAKSRLKVLEASDGQELVPDQVYLAPGGKHMLVRRRPSSEGGSGLILGLNENPPENSCRPSVDVLFRSMAAHYDGNILAVIMTGMGSDGCEGVRALKRRGCYCLTQSEATCVVYGMPLSVDEAGLSDEQVPLERLAARITFLVKGKGPT